jgi:hypothetical protein
LIDYPFLCLIDDGSLVFERKSSMMANDRIMKSTGAWRFSQVMQSRDHGTRGNSQDVLPSRDNQKLSRMTELDGESGSD